MMKMSIKQTHLRVLRIKVIALEYEKGEVETAFVFTSPLFYCSLIFPILKALLFHSFQNQGR